MGWPKEAFLNLRQIVTPKSRPQPGGNLLYVKDDNNLYLLDHDGTEHEVGGSGGIQSIVEGTNISVDDTDPDNPVVSASFTETLPVSIIDAAGDLIVGSAPDTAARLAAGTDDQVLTMVSGSPAWADAPTGGGSTAKQAVFKFTGTLSTGVGQTRLYNDTGSSWTLTSVRASVETSPSGGTVVVDVNKNGTTVFTTQANRPSIASAGTTAKSTTIDVTNVDDGDYLTVDIDTLTSPAAQLTVTIGYTE